MYVFRALFTITVLYHPSDKNIILTSPTKFTTLGKTSTDLEFLLRNTTGTSKIIISTVPAGKLNRTDCLGPLESCLLPPFVYQKT